jgi:hypothetical protein
VFGEAWKVGLHQSGCRSRIIGLGLGLFGVGLASRTAVLRLQLVCSVPPGRRPARMNNCSVQRMLLVCKMNNCSVFESCPAGALNYCSLTHAAASWDFEHLEQLFAASPVYQLTRRSKPNYCSFQTQLGFGSDFTIVRSRAQTQSGKLFPDPSQDIPSTPE